MNKLILPCICLALLLALPFTTGCASTALKGTPLYTAAEERPAGLPEDRIWAWPLLYYRDPVLSVVWPLFEKNDEFIALRPCFSVYGLDRPKHQYNVLWPIAQWDWETGNHRIFPYFWGNDYRVLPPLYWHFGRPGSDRGSDALLPLWSYSWNAHDYSLWALGPVYHAKRWGSESGWHLWPLVGQYNRGVDTYRFFVWPIGHQWRSGDTSGADTIIPLYYRSWDPSSRTFLSPLWLSHSEPHESWQCLFPLCYHSRSREEETTLFPIGGWGSSAAGLSQWSALFPLYLHTSDNKNSRFISIPWSQGRYQDGSAWRLAFPLYYNNTSPRESIHLTPLGGLFASTNRTDWAVIPVLSWGTRNSDSHSTWIAAGLAHHSEEVGRKSHHVLPLYYASSDADSSTFLSIPYSRGETISGTRWDLALPLVYRYRSPEANRWITPLAAGGESADGKERWHTILPLYFSQQDTAGRTLATLAGGFHQDNEGTDWTLWPLLCWGRHDDRVSDFWALAPLFHVRRTPDYVTHHALPLYYWNSRNDNFLSLLAARWRTAASNTVTLFPPALTWRTEAKDRQDLWVAGGLAHASWGGKPGPHHVIPLYYRNKETDTFISPFVAQWTASENIRNTLVPPLLGMGSTSPDQGNLWMLAGLARASWGEKPGPNYLIPLYYSDPANHQFLSLAFCRTATGKRETRLYPPLLTLDVTDGTKRDIWGLAGLAHRSIDYASHTSSGYVAPLFYYDSTNVFLTPVFGRYNDGDNGFFYPLTPLAGVRTGRQSGGWLFPLFSHRRDLENGNVNGMFLWGPYWKNKQETGSWMFPFYLHERDLAPLNGEEPVRDYTYVFPTFLTSTHVYTPDGITRKQRRITARNLFLPFWSRFREGNLGQPPDATENWAMLGLWWSRFEHTTAPGASQASTQVSCRLLGWLWRYDRQDNDVTIDIFPGISMDRKGNGYRRTSVFYRLYRNEVSPEGKRKMDLLFLPIVRP